MFPPVRRAAQHSQCTTVRLTLTFDILPKFCISRYSRRDSNLRLFDVMLFTFVSKSSIPSKVTDHPSSSYFTSRRSFIGTGKMYISFWLLKEIRTNTMENNTIQKRLEGPKPFDNIWIKSLKITEKFLPGIWDRSEQTLLIQQYDQDTSRVVPNTLF